MPYKLALELRDTRINRLVKEKEEMEREAQVKNKQDIQKRILTK